MANPFTRRADPYMLVVGMTGVKMGDRLIHVGCEHAGRLGAVAAKVGLSGRALAVTPDEPSAARARKGAAEAGALVDVDVAPPTALAAEAASFDVAVIDDTGGLLTAMTDGMRLAAVGELGRVLRPGGRVVVIGAAARRGLNGLFGGHRPVTPAAETTDAFAAGGFRSVRLLAERDGLLFIEGIKPR